MIEQNNIMEQYSMCKYLRHKNKLVILKGFLVRTSQMFTNKNVSVVGKKRISDKANVTVKSSVRYVDIRRGGACALFPR